MNQVLRFHVDCFELTVDNGAYIVAVKEDDTPTAENNYSELPPWVFQSKHAIWLAEENASLFERASKGEQIKQKLRQRTV